MNMVQEPSKQPFEWYDIKTKFKKIIRSIGYSSIFQELICWLVYGYMNLVYYTSKKKYLGLEKVMEIIRQNKSCILCVWHANIIMIPFITKIIRKNNPSYQYFGLASRHGDGQFVSRVIEKFGAGIVSGSSKGHRKASRGIDIGSFKKIFEELEVGKAMVITPDGPRGPRHKINGHVVDIAKISGSPLLPCSYSSSKQKILNTWDRFRFPLPFSTICYDFGELIYVSRDADVNEVEKTRLLLEEEINASTYRADQSFQEK